MAVTMGGFEDLLERTASVLSILGERPMALPPVPNLISPHVRGGDIYTVVLVTTILLMVRLAMHVSLLPALLPKTMRRSRQRKVSENVFYTAFYVSTTILGYVVYTREPWSLNLFSNESQVLPLFSPFPAPLSPLMRMYFLTELGFYVGALLFLVVDEHRKDFGIMVVHHVVSICLVVGSYLGGWVRFGAIVLALHDVGDVFLYGAKAAHNLGGCFGADTGLFVLFAVTFYVTRLVCLPRILYTLCFETFGHLLDNPDFNSWAVYSHLYLPQLLGFGLGLNILLLLHCYWFCLILLMIYRQLRGKSISEQGDVRSDSESDSDEEPATHED